MGRLLRFLVENCDESANRAAGRKANCSLAANFVGSMLLHQWI